VAVPATSYSACNQLYPDVASVVPNTSYFPPPVGDQLPFFQVTCPTASCPCHTLSSKNPNCRSTANSLLQYNNLSKAASKRRRKLDFRLDPWVLKSVHPKCDLNPLSCLHDIQQDHRLQRSASRAWDSA